MKYKTVSIDAYNGEWKVTFSRRDDHDRVEKKTLPNPHGFYYYPETMEDGAALDELLACMIARHDEEIRNLQISRMKLSKIQRENRES